jgi:hypothetical protein
MADTAPAADGDGRHVAFLDDAARCGTWIGELLARAPAPVARG